MLWIKFSQQFLIYSFIFECPRHYPDMFHEIHSTIIYLNTVTSLPDIQKLTHLTQLSSSSNTIKHSPRGVSD